jgi:hypothetical protein
MSDKDGSPNENPGLKPNPAEESAPPSLGKRLSDLVTLLTPYKEIIGLGSLAVGAISAGVALAVSYFATESELFYLECRINSSIETQYLPMQTSILAASIDWRTSQIRQLAQLNTNNSTSAAIVAMTSEINDLTKQQTNLANEVKKKIDERAEKCNNEAPKKSVKTN